MSAQPVPYLTPEMYLEIERAADRKSEYFEGQMFAMAGGTYSHFRLIGNLMGELYQALRGTGCQVGPTELRVRTPGGLYTYPDIVAICGPPHFADDQKDTLLNPVLLVEVLSKSTEGKDRGLKFREYRKLESLREYALVSQFFPLIEVFYKSDEGDWRLRESFGLDEFCEFTSINARVAIADVYNDVALEPPPTEAELNEK